ncbi:PH domain-containing protein [Paenibacillus sp. 481]|uniref:PH domain-containing protein n=1 Tax=Paenibacillus sp. 481 TaxID=2835869 RepID=UPI001E3FC01D|nr:PH domain-containing protein [Paenibacillus sp. 481]UHA72488.1 PH domain-containing protein [Paenibacillus sp. 481]
MKISNPSISDTAKRLHPVSLLFFAAKTLKESLHALPLVPLLVFLASLIYGDNVSWVAVSVLAGSFVFLLIFVFGWIRWYRYKYVLEQGRLYIEQGVWFRKKTWMAKERVLSLDLTVRMYQRPFGLVSLNISTAGAGDSVEELSSISRAEAERIRAALTLSPLERSQARSTDTQSHISLALGDLLNYSVSSVRIGIVLAVFGAIVARFDDVRAVFDIWKFIIEGFGSLWFVWFPLLLMAAAWLIAVIFTILMDFNYELERSDDNLIIRRGLLDKKTVTISLQRIQAVKVVGNMFRRPFGLVSVYIVIAGKKESDTSSIILYPLLKISKLDGFLKSFVPGFELPVQWHGRPEPSARSHFMLLPISLCLFIVVPGMIWLPGYYGWLTLVLPVVAALWGELRYRQAAWSVQDGQLAIRYGGFSLRRVLIPKKRMQWHRISQTALQARRGHATLKIAVAGGREPAVFAIRHAPHSRVSEVAHFLEG